MSYIGILTVVSDNENVTPDTDPPVATCYVDGMEDATAPTVTEISTGVYRVSVTPTTSGNVVEVLATVIVDTLTQVVPVDVCSTDGVSANVVKWLGDTPAALAASYVQSHVSSIGSGESSEAAATSLAIAANAGIALESTLGTPADTDLATDIAAINTALSSTNVTVTFTSPVAEDNTVEIYEGADYSGTRALSWTYTGIDLTAANITLRLQKTAGYEQETSTGLSFAGAAAADGDDWTVTVEMDADDTGSLDGHPGNARNYRYQVIATIAGETIVLIAGYATVKPLILLAS